jgi:aminocarboxymuconate-semialdehyde decarboxylase
LLSSSGLAPHISSCFSLAKEFSALEVAVTGRIPMIDMHAHFYGCGLEIHLRQRAERPCLRETANGFEMLAMNGAFPFEAAHWDPDTVLTQMDATGVQRRLLTFPGALCLDALPVVEIGPAIAAFNTELAGLQAHTGGRLMGLAGLPLASPELAAAELRRARRELRLAGAILPSDYFSTIANVRGLIPVLNAANETGALLMLHPGPMAGEMPAAVADEFPQYRTSAVALQAQTSQVVLTLLLSDLLDVYSRIRFQVINLGGTIPFIFERMESIARHRNPETPFPTARLRRLWFDSASMGPKALEAAVDLYGADRIMLGTDWPIFRDPPWETSLNAAQLPEDALRQVASGTAQALFDALEASNPASP